MTKYIVGLAVFFTYALMVMGNVVTTTGSGLACPDWPLCYGTMNPPHEIQIWFEWSHRLLGGSTGILLLLSAIVAYKNTTGAVRWLTGSALGLLVVGAIFGGIIVMIEAPLLEGALHLAVISFHIVLATIIFTLMILALRKLTNSQLDKENSFYAIIFGILLLQVFIGILVRYGGAGMACGPSFPLCNGSLLPSVLNFESMIHLTHRVMAVGIWSYSLWYFMQALKTKNDLPRAAITLLLFTCQASIGIGLVQTSMFLPLIILHGAVGFLTLGWVAYRAAPALLQLRANAETHVAA